jgi:hypothetical protein
MMGFDHDALERVEAGDLAQEVHPAHRSVQGMGLSPRSRVRIEGLGNFSDCPATIAS